MDNTLQQIKKNISSKNIFLLDSWLNEKYNLFKEDYNDSTLLEKRIMNEIDLTDIDLLIDKQKVISIRDKVQFNVKQSLLNQYLFCQIVSINNIGDVTHQQEGHLDEIEKIDNKYLRTDDDEEKNKVQEKKKVVYKFELTTGVDIFYGFEYEKIDCLSNLQFTKYKKVMIGKDIEIRRGILYLKQIIALVINYRLNIMGTAGCCDNRHVQNQVDSPRHQKKINIENEKIQKENDKITKDAESMLLNKKKKDPNSLTNVDKSQPVNENAVISRDTSFKKRNSNNEDTPQNMSTKFRRRNKNDNKIETNNETIIHSQKSIPFEDPLKLEYIDLTKKNHEESKILENQNNKSNKLNNSNYIKNESTTKIDEHHVDLTLLKRESTGSEAKNPYRKEKKIKESDKNNISSQVIEKKNINKEEKNQENSLKSNCEQQYIQEITKVKFEEVSLENYDKSLNQYNENVDSQSIPTNTKQINNNSSDKEFSLLDKKALFEKKILNISKNNTRNTYTASNSLVSKSNFEPRLENLSLSSTASTFHDRNTQDAINDKNNVKSNKSMIDEEEKMFNIYRNNLREPQINFTRLTTTRVKSEKILKMAEALQKHILGKNTITLGEESKLNSNVVSQESDNYEKNFDIKFCKSLTVRKKKKNTFI